MTSPGERIEQVDPYGNLMHVVTLEQPHREARIVAEGIAEISDVVEATPETSRLPPLTYLAPTPLTRLDAALRALADHCLGRHPRRAGRSRISGQHPARRRVCPWNY